MISSADIFNRQGEVGFKNMGVKEENQKDKEFGESNIV